MIKKTNLIKAIIIAVLLIVMVAGSVFLVAKFLKNNATSEGDISIDTPYCKVIYPGKWKGQIHTQVQDEENYVLTFYTQDLAQKDHAIFSLSFGDGDGTCVGMIATEEHGIINVYLQIYDLNNTAQWSEEEKDKIYSMRDDINYTLDNLPFVHEKEESQEETGAIEIAYTEPTVFEDYVIETPYAKLYYPGQWTEYLRVDILEADNGCTVAFYGVIDNHPETELFTISMTEDKSGDLGVLEGTNVGVSFNVTSFAPNQSWSEEQIRFFLAMQEDVNYIIGRLALIRQLGEDLPDQAEEGAEESQSATESNESEDIIIHTPYCELYFPRVWAGIIRTECTEDIDYRVEFYGSAKEGKEILLFTVCFAGEEGIFIGSIPLSDSDTVNVSIIINEDIGYEGQTEEELTMLLQIQEDLNYLISMLPLFK